MIEEKLKEMFDKQEQKFVSDLKILKEKILLDVKKEE